MAPHVSLQQNSFHVFHDQPKLISAAYVVTAGDLKPITVDNKLIKFADDTYLITPASNCHTRSAEIDNNEHWAQINNLKLDNSFTKPIAVVLLLQSLTFRD